MADEKVYAAYDYDATNVERIQRLAELNLLLAQAQRRKQLNEELEKSTRIDDKKYKAIKDEISKQEDLIKHYTKQIKLQRDMVTVGDKYLENLEEEIEGKRVSIKTFKDYINTLKASNSSLKDLKKNFAQTMQAAKNAGYRSKDIRDTATFGSIFKQYKSLDFKDAAESRILSGGLVGVVKNTFPILEALGDRAALAGGALAGVAIAGKMFYDNILVPSARMRNIAGQQLGIGAENRNLYGGSWLREWRDRTLLGYSSEQQQGLYSALVGALRLNPETYQTSYNNALRGMMGVQQLWGTDTGTIAKIYKAYKQTGVSADQLSTKFDGLMRNVEGTGWTTAEYSDTIKSNIMYLKNFGVNLDSYANGLRKYGKLIEREVISPANLAPGVYNSESMGNLAFMATKMLESGAISSRQLGVGLGATPVELGGAMRNYLATGGIGAMQKVVQGYLSSPEIYGMLQNAGAFNSQAAFKESLLSLGLPMSGAIANTIRNMSVNDVWNIFKEGRIDSYKLQEGIGGKSQGKIVNEAVKNVASTTEGLKGLLLKIAGMIKAFGDGLDSSPQGL